MQRQRELSWRRARRWTSETTRIRERRSAGRSGDQCTVGIAQHGDYVGTVQAMLDAGATPPEVTDALVASDEVKRVLDQHR